jgi:thiamine phosphate synthase YjbQ (UPF0047 family)
MESTAMIFRDDYVTLETKQRRECIQRTLSITAGKLEFGPWQHVMYAELDGTRPKNILLKIVGE